MAWLQLSLDTNHEQAEEIADLLEQFGAISVSFAALSDEKIFHEPDDPTLSDPELWQQTRITALLHPDMDLDITLLTMQQKIGSDNISHYEYELVQDKDWVREYQGQYQPIIFDDKFAITPSWCEVPSHIQNNIELDPGLAFGTGSHPTTYLCIQYLLQQDLQNKVVIDYGCGTGILAMVAASLGAEQVFAVDIDPQAVESANANIEKNNLQEKIQVGLVGQLELPEADILVANILMKPLQGLAKQFADLVKADGQITLSGILCVQAEECADAYIEYFQMQEPIFREEWARVDGRRKS